MNILETERLILRPFTLDDLDDFAAICGDPEVMRYYPAPWSREHLKRFIRNHIARQERIGYSLWAVVHKADGRFIGFCGLVPQTVEGAEDVEGSCARAWGPCVRVTNGNGPRGSASTVRVLDSRLEYAHNGVHGRDSGRNPLMRRL